MYLDAWSAKRQNSVRLSTVDEVMKKLTILQLAVLIRYLFVLGLFSNALTQIK